MTKKLEVEYKSRMVDTIECTNYSVTEQWLIIFEPFNVTTSLRTPGNPIVDSSYMTAKNEEFVYIASDQIRVIQVKKH